MQRSPTRSPPQREQAVWLERIGPVADFTLTRICSCDPMLIIVPFLLVALGLVPAFHPTMTEVVGPHRWSNP